MPRDWVTSGRELIRLEDVRDVGGSGGGEEAQSGAVERGLSLPCVVGMAGVGRGPPPTSLALSEGGGLDSGLAPVEDASPVGAPWAAPNGVLAGLRLCMLPDGAPDPDAFEELCHEVVANGGEVRTPPPARRDVLRPRRLLRLGRVDEPRPPASRAPTQLLPREDAGGPRCSYVVCAVLPEDVVLPPTQKTASLVWVEECLLHGRLLSTSAKAFYRPLPNTPSGCENLVICVTGYQGELRNELQHFAEALGATYSRTLDRNITHLIAYDFDGAKYDRAVRYSHVHVVNHRWLNACMTQWRKVPEAPYKSRSGREIENSTDDDEDEEDDEDVPDSQNDDGRDGVEAAGATGAQGGAAPAPSNVTRGPGVTVVSETIVQGGVPGVTSTLMGPPAPRPRLDAAGKQRTSLTSVRTEITPGAWVPPAHTPGTRHAPGDGQPEVTPARELDGRSVSLGAMGGSQGRGSQAADGGAAALRGLDDTHHSDSPDWDRLNRAGEPVVKSARNGSAWAGAKTKSPFFGIIPSPATFEAAHGGLGRPPVPRFRPLMEDDDSALAPEVLSDFVNEIQNGRVLTEEERIHAVRTGERLFEVTSNGVQRVPEVDSVRMERISARSVLVTSAEATSEERAEYRREANEWLTLQAPQGRRVRAKARYEMAKGAPMGDVLLTTLVETFMLAMYRVKQESAEDWLLDGDVLKPMDTIVTLPARTPGNLPGVTLTAVDRTIGDIVRELHEQLAGPGEITPTPADQMADLRPVAPVAGPMAGISEGVEPEIEYDADDGDPPRADDDDEEDDTQGELDLGPGSGDGAMDACHSPVFGSQPVFARGAHPTQSPAFDGSQPVFARPSQRDTIGVENEVEPVPDPEPEIEPESQGLVEEPEQVTEGGVGGGTDGTTYDTPGEGTTSAGDHGLSRQTIAVVEEPRDDGTSGDLLDEGGHDDDEDQQQVDEVDPVEEEPPVEDDDEEEPVAAPAHKESRPKPSKPKSKTAKSTRTKVAAAPPSPPREAPRVFALSGMHTDEQVRYSALIHRLGGRVASRSHSWDDRTTHVVFGMFGSRNEKFLSGAAARAWLLDVSYLDSSDQNGAFLDESGYVWDGGRGTDSGLIAEGTAVHWAHGRGNASPAFKGLSVTLCPGAYAEGERALLSRVMQAGGATMLLANANPRDVDVAITPMPVRPSARLSALVKAGVPIVSPDFITTWLAQPENPMDGFLVEGTRMTAKLRGAAQARSSEYRASQQPPLQEVGNAGRSPRRKAAAGPQRSASAKRARVR